MTNTKSIEEMSPEELEAILKEKKKAQRAAQSKRERDYERKKDNFVLSTVQQFQSIQEMLRNTKHEVVSRGNALFDELHEIYERDKKDIKQFSLVSADGLHKVVIERAERQGFNEKAEIAIDKIKDILRNKFAARNQVMYRVIDGILMKNKKGDYDERLVSKLRKFEPEIDDPKFSEALDLLSQSFVLTGTALYVRAYHKRDLDGKWEDITVQFSSL